MISFRESLFKRDCFCYDNPWRKILNKREKYEGADWIMHFIGHFKTITRHKILVAKGCFKLGLYYQGINVNDIVDSLKDRKFGFEETVYLFSLFFVIRSIPPPWATRIL